MIGFLIGLFVGGALGVVTMCIVSVSGHSDQIENNTIMNEEDENYDQNENDS